MKHFSIQQIRDTIQEKIKHMRETGVCVIPLGDSLLAIRVSGEKYLWREDILWDDPDHPDVEKALARLKARRPDATRFSLAVNFPSLSVKTIHMPAMTASELFDAMGWEEDRLFSMEASLSWQVLSDDDSGRKLLVSGVEHEDMLRWKEAAKAAGMTMNRAFSITDVPPSEEAALTLYGGKTKGFLLFSKGNIRETRKVSRLEEAGEIASFLSRMKERHPFDDCRIGYVPLADSGEEERSFWKLKLAGAFPDAHILDTSLWQVLAGRMNRPRNRGDKEFAEDTIFPDISEGAFPFSLSKGVLAASLLLCVLAGGYYAGEYYSLSEAREASARLAPVRSERARSRKNRQDIKQMAAVIQGLDHKYGTWEKRLITLADCMPKGTVLTRIQRENSRIIITGTAVEGSGPMELKKRLSFQWKEEGRLLSRKMGPVSKLIRFELAFDQAEANHERDG